MHDPSGWWPVPLSFAYNLQMTDLKLHRKHSSIAWYHPDKVKLITCTYCTYSTVILLQFFIQDSILTFHDDVSLVAHLVASNYFAI